MHLFRSISGGRQEGGPRIHAAQVYALSNINAMSQNRLLIISPLRMPRAASKFGARDLLTTRRRWEARRFWVANAIDINCPIVAPPCTPASSLACHFKAPKRPTGSPNRAFGDKRIYQIFRYRDQSCPSAEVLSGTDVTLGLRPGNKSHNFAPHRYPLPTRREGE